MHIRCGMIRSHLLYALSATLVLGACSKRHASSAGVTPTPPRRDANTVPQPDEDSVHSRMLHQYFDVAALERAVVSGNLKQVRASASALISYDGTQPPTWRPYISAVKHAAQEAHDAHDTNAAATATAAVIERCGACHAALKVAMKAAAHTDSPAAVTVRGTMQRHQWAMDVMRVGLMFADEVLWDEGRKILRDSPLHPNQVLSTGPIDPNTVDRIHRVRELTTTATPVQSDRQRVYGALLSTCAGCHDSYARAPK